MTRQDFPPWPSFTQEEAEAVSRVLLSNKVNYWTGTEGKQFEEEFAHWAGVKHAVAVANGTLALELALKAIGVTPGDEVVVTPRSFIASVSSVVLSGATPVFADVDLDSQNITAESISKVLSPKTRAILCVHHAGWPCDMDRIMSLAEEHGLYVIEDCAQAHGAKYREKPVGSLAHIAAWSFCQDKIITTGGEGGMVTTNDPQLWRRVWEYKDHGKSYAKVCEKKSSGVFAWMHDSFGSNMRMTEMQAAIGRIQLKRMPIWHASRQSNAQRMHKIFASYPEIIRLPDVPSEIEHAWYKYYVFVKPEGLAAGWNRDRIIRELVDNGIPCFSGSCPEIYLEKAFDNVPYRPNMRLEHARELGETSMMLLVHPGISEEQFNDASHVIDSVLTVASGR